MPLGEFYNIILQIAHPTKHLIIYFAEKYHETSLPEKRESK